MGLILDDNDKGVHAEARRESFIIYSDSGREGVELSWEQLDELDMLVQKLKGERDRRSAKAPVRE